MDWKNLHRIGRNKHWFPRVFQCVGFNCLPWNQRAGTYGTWNSCPCYDHMKLTEVQSHSIAIFPISLLSNRKTWICWRFFCSFPMGNPSWLGTLFWEEVMPLIPMVVPWMPKKFWCLASGDLFHNYMEYPLELWFLVYIYGHGFHSYVANYQRIMNLDNSYSMTFYHSLID